MREEYIIEPPKGLVHLNFKELFRYRDLFLILAWRDISVRYKQTALGVIWAVFQPLITMLIFSFIFNRMAKIESGDNTPYPIFLYVGLLLWQYYAGTLSNASQSLISNTNLVSKVYFPRLILPAASSIAGLIDLVISSVLLVGLMIWFRFLPAVTWTGLAALPLLLLGLILCSLGFGLLLAALNVKYRDVRYALPFFIQILMYVTPVIYPASLLQGYPVINKLMLWLNPMSGLISNARAALLGRTLVNWEVLGISLLMSVVFFFVGLTYFRKTERYFADIA